MAFALENRVFESLIGEGIANLLKRNHRMKHAIALLVLSAVSAFSTSAAYACNHDILCPVKWVWSDGEGTCIEDTKETS